MDDLVSTHDGPAGTAEDPDGIMEGEDDGPRLLTKKQKEKLKKEKEKVCHQ